MDILIKNSKLPEKGTVLLFAVFSNGNVDFRYEDNPKEKTTQAIEVPPHGDLKDADFIKDTYPGTYEIIKGILNMIPTVLEASK